MTYVPQITLICPFRNASKTIERCINSVVNQTYTDWELILVDDHSEDETSSIIRTKYSDDRLMCFTNLRTGVSAARNTGLSKAKGKYVAFIDADDFLPNDSLQIRIDVVENNPSFNTVGGCFGSSFYFEGSDSYAPMQMKSSEDCTFLNRTALFESGEKTGLEYIWDKVFCLSVIREANLFFNEKYERYEDWLFVLDYISVCDYCFGCSQNNVYYYVQSQSNTTSNTFYGREIDVVKAIYHRYLSALSFAGIDSDENREGVNHFLTNKVVRALYMAASSLDSKNLRDLCGKVMRSPDIKNSAFSYIPRNSKEKMDMVNLIRHGDENSIFEYLMSWRNEQK